MQFLFFNAAGTILFAREDAESAGVTHEEMRLQALFPYDGGKEILRGMRIGYQDVSGYQVYEIRSVRTLEPDHFQEISAENIAISELTDEICGKAEINNKTVSQVLNATDGLLKGTGWVIGTDATSNTSSCDIALGDIWSATRTIQQNWNVYILPRVTVGAAGITGKYLDVIPAGGTWRGCRLSLDKNASEVGVTWDDSKLKTALYAYGQEKNDTALTFKDIVWTATADHPAKPAGQIYLEDPAATAAYGRNGRPRFGFYQNASITNATTLLEKTWEVLQTVSVPDVTVSASVSDLYRLGYADVPLRLHDTALVEIRPTGVVLQKEIVQYSEDLLDPLQSRLTIGTYIPNIIYINRQTAKRGGGGRGSGDSQDPLEYTIENNTVQITVDSRGLNSLCVGTGAQLNPDGSLVVDPVTGKPVFIDGGDNMWSQISQNKTQIALKVAKGDVATQLAVECGNVHVTGTPGSANLTVDGYVTSTGLQSEIASLAYVEVNKLVATSLGDDEDTIETGYIDSVISESVSTGTLSATTVTIGSTDLADAVYSFGTPTASGGQISIPWTKVDGTAGTPINFNIADTAYYQSHVGIANTGSWVWDSNESDYVRLITPNAGQPATITIPSITVDASLGTSASFSAYAYGPVSGGSRHSVSLAKSFYLKSSGSNVYVTNADATPAEGTNVVAKIAAGGQTPDAIVRTGYSTVDKTVTVKATSNGIDVLTGQVISASELWTDGQNDGRTRGWFTARNEHSTFPNPLETTTTIQSTFSIAYPGPTYDTSDFYNCKIDVTSDNNYVYVADSSKGNNYAVARISTSGIKKTGWDLARSKIVLPSAITGTHSSFSFTLPASAYDTDNTFDYSVSQSGSTAIVTDDDDQIVARINISGTSLANAGNKISIGGANDSQSPDKSSRSTTISGKIWYDDNGTWKVMKNSDGTDRTYSISISKVNAKVYQKDSDGDFVAYPAGHLIWTTS